MEFLVKNVKDLPNLHYLNVSCNKVEAAGVKYLNENMKFIPNILHLNLSDNELGSKGMKYLCEGLNTIQELEELILSSNNIGEKGASLLAESLKSLENLRYLDISNNDIGGKGIEVISEKLNNVPCLEHLDLNNNNIDETGIECFCKQMQSIPGLKELDLHGNIIGFIAIDNLTKELGSVPALNSLSLYEEDKSVINDNPNNNDDTTSSGRFPLMPLRSISRAICKLQESGAITSNDAERLVVNLVTNNKGVHITDLIKELGEKLYTRDIIVAIANKENLIPEMIDEFHSGHELYYSLLIRVCFEDVTKKSSIIPNIKSNKNIITTLLRGISKDYTWNLSKKKFNDEDIKFLSTELKSIPTLKTINLNENEITDEGLDILLDNLTATTKLSSFSISNNLITNKGMEILANKLDSIKNVVDLDISENKYNDYGINKVALKIRDKLQTINTLDISRNEITPFGLQYIKAKLSFINILKYEDLKENNDEETMMKLLETDDVVMNDTIEEYNSSDGNERFFPILIIVCFDDPKQKQKILPKMKYEKQPLQKVVLSGISEDYKWIFNGNEDEKLVLNKEGVAVLCMELENVPKLKELCFCNVGISSKEIESISNYLDSNKELITIDLSCIYILLLLIILTR